MLLVGEYFFPECEIRLAQNNSIVRAFDVCQPEIEVIRKRISNGLQLKSGLLGADDLSLELLLGALVAFCREFKVEAHIPFGIATPQGGLISLVAGVGEARRAVTYNKIEVGFF